VNWPTDRLRSLLSPGSDDTDTDSSVDGEAEQGDQEGEDDGVSGVHSSGVSPAKIEEAFCTMDHGDRINLVRYPPRVSARMWYKFEQYVREDTERKEKWGIGVQVLDRETQPPGCTEDDGVAELMLVKEGETETYSETTENDTTAGFGGRLGTSGTGLSGRTEVSERTGETATEGNKREITREIRECSTLKKDCRVNRRAFWKLGNETLATGSAARERLREQLDAVLTDSERQNPE
jgi:hypothetical protein